MYKTIVTFRLKNDTFSLTPNPCRPGSQVAKIKEETWP